MAIMMKDLAERYRVSGGGGFRLNRFSPEETWNLKSKDRAQELLREGVEQLSDLQGKLYAQEQWSLLLIFQAMDAAGKDGTIKHVLSGVNPQGCDVRSFKVPSNEELNHDFLWRCQEHLPERGRIGIFNRSYYEEVLVVRVHPELLDLQRVPRKLVTKRVWTERFEDIAAFERHLGRDGTVIRKFFLNVSKREQKRRFLERLDEPRKNWKFSLADSRERGFWSDYMSAYEDMIRHTATDQAPWYIVPADHKWFTRLVVAAVVVEALQSLKLEYPQLDAARRKQLAAARRELK
jgi:PPK2 family polyphosphate:nucleotide phosphotransferase